MSLHTPINGSNTAPLLLAAEINYKAGLFTFSADPDPVETSILLLTGDLRVCSLSSWDPTSLPTQVPTPLLPSLPCHQKIHTHTHTHIIFSPFDVYFNLSHQFTMLVWESVFSWLSISKKADLWRRNSKLSDSFYSVTGCPGCTSPGSLILGWLSLPSLFILPPSLTLPHILVAFLAVIQILTCTRTEKTVWFSCFLHHLRMSGIWLEFLAQGSFRGLLTLMVIFHALKDKRRVLVLRKGYNIWVGREISWKGRWPDEDFCARQGQCRGLGQQRQWRPWGA